MVFTKRFQIFIRRDRELAECCGLTGYQQNNTHFSWKWLNHYLLDELQCNGSEGAILLYWLNNVCLPKLGNYRVIIESTVCACQGTRWTCYRERPWHLATVTSNSGTADENEYTIEWRKAKEGKEFPCLLPYSVLVRRRQKSLPVKSVSPINYFPEKELKDAPFLCNICTLLMTVEVIHMTWGGKYNIKINQLSWKWEFFSLKCIGKPKGKSYLSS